MNKTTLAVVAIIGLIGVSSAFADDERLYLLGGVGQKTGGDSGQSAVQFMNRSRDAL